MNDGVAEQRKIADVLMPYLGDGVESAIIVEWLKNVGHSVTPDDALAEVETEKGVLEITADVRGVIQSIHFGVGATVSVGEVVATIATEPWAFSVPMG